MRYILFAFFLFAAYSVEAKYPQKPKNIDEAFALLDKMFDDTAKYSFMTFPESDAVSPYHMSLGMWMRNNWGLWGKKELYWYLHRFGFEHPDDMSGVILVSYHRYLNHKPIDLAQQLKDRPKLVVTSDSTRVFDPPLKMMNAVDRLKYFNVGDTITTTIWGEKKRIGNDRAVDLRAVAIVHEKRKDNLLVELIHLPSEKGVVPESKQGTVIEASPYSCMLIPPRGWKWQ